MEKENVQELSEETLENVTGGVGLIAEEGHTFGDSCGIGKGLPEEGKKTFVTLGTAVPKTETEIPDEKNVWPPW